MHVYEDLGFIPCGRMMKPDSLVRKNILKSDPYVAGKPIQETKREFGLKEVFKLASNENPLGPSPKALSAISRALCGLNRYPDSRGYLLKKELAAQLGVGSDSIVLGNGSDELIDVVIKTFVEDDEFILTSESTFLEYAIIGQVNNRKVKRIPLCGFRYDLKAIAAAATAKCKLIFIANPNNPTGTYVSRKEVEAFLRIISKNTIVVFDEAYDTFIDVDDYPHSLRYLKNKNVIILKTFSKAFGLAGLRIGYALADKALAKYMERVRQPFNVNSLALVAAVAALDDRAYLKRSRKANHSEKKFLYAQLKRMGLDFVPSVTNFILLNTGKNGVKVFRALLKFGVIVRDMQQYGLNDYIRVTIGKRRENEKFIKALKKVL